MAMRKDASFVKIERMKEIAKKIVKTFPAGAIYDKVILTLEVDMGLSNSRAHEYLDKVIEKQGWIVQNGVIKSELTE